MPHEDAQPARPRLLFTTPTFPNTRGNGLAMRAGMWLEALARRYRVALLVIPLFDASPGAEAFARAHAESVTVVPPAPAPRVRWWPAPRRGAPQPELLRLFAAQSRAAVDAVRTSDDAGDFEVIHAFRLYTAPVALALHDRIPTARLHLDLDDIESMTREGLAALHEAGGHPDAAAREAEDARRFASAERELIPRFDRAYVCSALDAERLRALVPTVPEVRVIPNAVRLPVSPAASRTTHPFTFLFVGTLAYEPNLDAIEWFARRVLPRIDARAGRRVLVRIVGRVPPGGLRSLARLEGVRVVGETPDVDLEYRDADAVIVPLRAGGGTRIKLLEAFAYHRPAVATSLGAEGIEAVSGRDLLVADDAEPFAAACLRLIDDPALGAALAESAAHLVAARYSQDVVNRLITEAT